MTEKNPKKKYFRPKKPVDKMTEEELDEFAQFIFDNLMGDIIVTGAFAEPLKFEFSKDARINVVYSVLSEKTLN